MPVDPAILEFLNEVRFATLATVNRDGAPQQSVMWYLIDDGEVLMNTARGRIKDKNLAADPRASVCVEDGYRYVAISGRVAMNDDQAVAQPDIQRLATRYHGADHARKMMAEQFGKQTRVTLRLTVDRIDAHGF